MRIKRKLFGVALVSVQLMLWTSLFASSALAEPHLGLQLDRTEAPLNRGDERLVYTATVKNEAGGNPKVDDELTCSTGSWEGDPAPTVTIGWLRNGAVIPGETASTYTVAAADEGKAIQCVVTGTNQSAPVGTADTEAGSNVITNVTTATGNGTLEAGSKEITGLVVTSGRFATGQTLSGECIPPGTTITVNEAFFIPKLFLSDPVTCSGTKSFVAGPGGFGPGASISGPGIPAGTTVTARSGQSLTLSNPATTSATGVAISGSFPPLAASLVSPAVVVEPQPSIAPPSGSSKPDVELDFANPEGPRGEGAELTCVAPTGWTAGEPISWSFQWLRNGVPAPHPPLETTATTSKYELQKADVEPASIIQCEVIATAGGVTVSALSLVNPTKPNLPRPYQFPVGGTPTINFANETSGLVTLKLELPGGEETYVFKALGSNWTCTKEAPTPSTHATVECTREDSLAPQDAFEPVQVVTSVGKNPPDLLVTKGEVSGGGSAPASASDEYTIPNPAVGFGFKAFETEVLDEFGDDYTKAGGHPFSAGATLEFNTHVRVEKEPAVTEASNGSPRVVRTDIPPGFIGNPEAIAELCPSVTHVLNEECPTGSVVGTIFVKHSIGETQEDKPIYAIEPEHGVVAQFAFKVARYVYTLAPELRPESGYAIALVTPPLAKYPEIFSASVKLCGFGAEVGTAEAGGQVVKRCLSPGDPGATSIPFLTNPTRCSGGPPTTVISADSWEEPGNFVSKAFTGPPLTECDQVPFEPEISLQPTSRRADSPTGMDVELTMPTAGLEDPFGTAQANLKSATVTLPVGMAVNPSAAHGLGACTLAQIGISAAGVPNANPVACPESSKVGSVEAKTPLLEETLRGDVYIAKQSANPFGSLLALYMAIESPERGILVKLAGRVAPNPVNGQLTVSFDDNPEVPVASVRLHFNGGERAALINPPLCGTYGGGNGGPSGIEAALSSWSAADPENPSPGEIVRSVSAFTIDEGPGGGPCPSGALAPKLSAGMLDAQAGSVSPFTLRLHRDDGTQRFRAVDVTMPRGLVAYLKGVPYCADAVLASIPTAAGAGAAQVAAPSCPAASRVGTVIAGAGAGTSPFYLDTGKAYLAGPYKGAPLSLAVVAPAVAGPFDLGNVVVRTALRVDPETAQITAVSDPLPTILEGILLDVRDIRINVDRPNFTLAPTNCEPMSVSARVTGELGATATATAPFQVGGCEKLKFKPDLKLRVHGKTRRGAYQRLAATLTYPKGTGYANIASAALTFPRSIFLAQEHIRTICTRVQFAADQCPKGSIYGKAKATSPLVDYALQGPVYLRSSSNPLPDVVVSLKGPAQQPIEIDLVGRVDSKNGGIRTTFAQAPDAPVTKFTLQMRGGKKSLLVNSRNLCKGTQRATVRMQAQNGLSRNFRPVVRNDCKKGKKR